MSERANGGTKGTGSLSDLLTELPTDRLRDEIEEFMGAAVGRGVNAVEEKLGTITAKLTDYAANGGSSTGKALASGAKAIGEGESPMRALMGAGLTNVKEKVSQMFGGGDSGGGGGKKIKVTNIVEHIDVGVPRQVAYNQWTQFEDFPSFMKKTELMEQEEDEKLKVKAQVFLSHRTWRSTIIEQVPDKRIVWQSEGDKGYVDGTVTFHELTPDLTRIMVVLEYHPKGLFEHTGNLWRAQGRRARLELKHFQRHVMTQTILQPEEVEGWRGEIRDKQVVREPDEEAGQEAEDRDEGEVPEDEPEAEGEYEEEPEDEYSEEPEDEAAYGDEPADQEEAEPDETAAPVDENEDEPADQGEYDEEPATTRDEDDEGSADEAPRRRRRVRAESR
ncbi:MAG TPA: SRPBCC family protein [Streptosporangiaceae bacterium]|jgi:uncharacterized membrane protein